MDCFKIHAILSDKCGFVEFNPASGTIGRGSYVAMTCENAVKIKYWFGDDEESAATVPVADADVQINEDYTLNAKGIKADDVEVEISTTSFTVEPTSVMFDFSKMDVIRVYADDYISITVPEDKILSQITIVKGANNFNLTANEGNLTSASPYVWTNSVTGADENGLTTVVFTSEGGRSDIQSTIKNGCDSTNRNHFLSC